MLWCEDIPGGSAGTRGASALWASRLVDRGHADAGEESSEGGHWSAATFVSASIVLRGGPEQGGSGAGLSQGPRVKLWRALGPTGPQWYGLFTSSRAQRSVHLDESVVASVLVHPVRLLLAWHVLVHVQHDLQKSSPGVFQQELSASIHFNRSFRYCRTVKILYHTLLNQHNSLRKLIIRMNNSYFILTKLWKVPNID